jgi:hypothetical protein
MDQEEMAAVAVADENGLSACLVQQTCKGGPLNICFFPTYNLFPTSAPRTFFLFTSPVHYIGRIHSAATLST